MNVGSHLSKRAELNPDLEALVPRSPTDKALKRLLREQFSFDAPE